MQDLYHPLLIIAPSSNNLKEKTTEKIEIPKEQEDLLNLYKYEFD